MLTVIQLYSFRIEIEDPERKYQHLIEWLKDDFKDFEIADDITHTINIKLGDFEQRALPLWFIKPSVFVFGWGKIKNYQYNNGVKLQINFSERRTAKITGSISECIYEVLYLLILSTVGEWLEEDGWVRLHGLSFQRENEAVVIVAPQGFGKSYMAEQMLSGTEGFSLIGDEIILVKNNNLKSFPLRLASKDLKSDSGLRSTFRNGRKHKTVLPARLLPIQKIKLGRLLLVNSNRFSIVVGNGLPQMIEFRWRFNGVRSLLKTIWNRLNFILSTEIQTHRVQRLDIKSLRELLDS